MDNACKYAKTHQAVVVINFTDTRAIVSIQDDGIGIPVEDFSRIFDPFYRSKNALSISGFGVGLSICRRIVELHQGQILVTSKLHEGSTFMVELPNVLAQL